MLMHMACQQETEFWQRGDLRVSLSAFAAEGGPSAGYLFSLAHGRPGCGRKAFEIYAAMDIMPWLKTI
jgi:hypothetical protein